MKTFELESLIKPPTQINVKQLSDRINHEIDYRKAPTCQLDIPQATNFIGTTARNLNELKQILKQQFCTKWSSVNILGEIPAKLRFFKSALKLNYAPYATLMYCLGKVSR